MQPNAQPVCVACHAPSASHSSGTSPAQRRVSGAQLPPASPPEPAAAPAEPASPPGPVAPLAPAPPSSAPPTGALPPLPAVELPLAPPLAELVPALPPVPSAKSRLLSLQLTMSQPATAAGTRSRRRFTRKSYAVCAGSVNASPVSRSSGSDVDRRVPFRVKPSFRESCCARAGALRRTSAIIAAAPAKTPRRSGVRACREKRRASRAAPLRRRVPRGALVRW